MLADIGDHQSLQESLSSFSAHIGAIRSMLEGATADSLILLDELGRATDPEEGGALGVVLLQTFLDRGAFTLASTHLMAMKVYGASTAGVRNGSMGFDEETLEPTYVLRLGAPGKSAGLDIAARLGLSPEVIEAARERMTNTERDVSRFLAELHKQMAAIEEERASVAAREQTVAARERSMEQTLERKYTARAAESGAVARPSSRANSSAARKRPSASWSQKARAKVAKTRREYQESGSRRWQELRPQLTPRSRNRQRPNCAEGVRVRLKWNPAARHGAKKLPRFELTWLKWTRDSSGCRWPRRTSKRSCPRRTRPGARKEFLFRQGPSFETSYREINLIGQRGQSRPASKCGKFLDSATLAQVERVRIVHGHGMGILKKAIADVLKHSPHVEKFYVAPPEEGGSGATIA